MGNGIIGEGTAVRGIAWRLFLGSLFNEGAIGFFFTLWPLYIASLGATPTQIGIVIGLSGVLRLLFLAPSSWLIDRLPLMLLIAGMRGLAAIGFLLCALAQKWWHLFPGIVAISAGVVAFSALSTLIAGLGQSSEERTRYFTWIYTVAPSIATIVTPAGAGWLAERWGLRSTLVAAGLTTACAAFIFATVGTARRSSSHREQASYRELLRHRSILLLAGLMVATIGGMMLGWVLAPNYLRDVHRFNVERIGWLGSIAALGSTALSLGVSRSRWLQNPFNTLWVATTAVTGGFLLLLLGSSLSMFILAYILRGGFLVAWSAFYSAFGLVTPESLRSRVFALAEILGSLGITLAPFLAGPLYTFDERLPILTGLLVSSLLLVGLAGVRKTLRAEATLTERGSDATTTASSEAGGGRASPSA